MALKEGVNMRITVDGKEIFHEVSADLSASTDFKEVASKDTSGKLSSPGSQSWSIPIEALYDNDGTTQEDLFSLATLWNAKTKVAVVLTTGVIGDVSFSGDAYIESFSTNATNEEFVTCSFTFRGDGDLTIIQVIA